MTEELEQLLKNLKLRRILEISDEQLRAAEKEDVTPQSVGSGHGSTIRRLSEITGAEKCRQFGHGAVTMAQMGGLCHAGGDEVPLASAPPATACQKGVCKSVDKEWRDAL